MNKIVACRIKVLRQVFDSGFRGLKLALKHTERIFSKLQEKRQNFLFPDPEKHAVLMIKTQAFPRGFVIYELRVSIKSVRVPRQVLFAHIQEVGHHGLLVFYGQGRNVLSAVGFFIVGVRFPAARLLLEPVEELGVCKRDKSEPGEQFLGDFFPQICLAPVDSIYTSAVE